MPIQLTDEDHFRIEKFLRIFFQGTKYGVELRAVLPGEAGIPTFIANPSEAKFFINRHKRMNIYFGVCTRQGGGKAEHCQEVPGLWVDIDFKDTPEDAARGLIAGFPLKPSFIIRSGGGLHLYWLFKEPALVKEFNPTPILNGLVAALGGDKGCTDIARIMRLPYTYNVKRDPAVQCVVETHDEIRYNPSDFDDFRRDEPAPKDGAAPAARQFDVIFERCAFLRHCQENAKDLKEPLWWAMVSNLCREPGGKDLIHTLSSPYPGYSPKETDKKILTALNASGPITCKKINELFPCGPCRVKAPVYFLRKANAAADEPGIEVVEIGKKKKFEEINEKGAIPPEGFIRDYLDCFAEVTDAPDIYHLFMAYFSIAVVLRDRVYFHLAGDRLFPNMWIVLIGGSSLFRKSTSLAKSKAIISRLNSNLVLPSDFTTEALLDILGATPQGAFYHSEFRNLYGMLSKDYMSGAKALLTELYDCPPEYRRETKGKTVNIRQPVVSLAAATTTEWLTRRDSSGDDFSSGFLARFLFVPAFKREKSLPFPPETDHGKYRGLCHTLQHIQDRYSLGQTKARYQPDAREAYIDWYQKFDQLDPFGGTPLAPFHARYQAYAHKLAILYTVSVGGDVTEMDVTSVVYATGTINLVARNLGHLYEKFLSFSKSDEQAKKVYSLIPEGKFVTKRDLIRASHLSSRDFENCMQTLMDSGFLECKPTIIRGQRTTAYGRIQA